MADLYPPVLIGPIRPPRQVGSGVLDQIVALRSTGIPLEQRLMLYAEAFQYIQDQLIAVLNALGVKIPVQVMNPSGGSHRAGCVPDPGPTAGLSRYLREDATFANPWSNPGGRITLSPSTQVAITSMRDFANNAAAIAGGLAVNDLYRVAGSDPRLIAQVF